MLATTGWYCVLLPHFYSLTSRFSVVRRLNIYQGKLVNIPTSVVRGEPSDVLWLWENSWYFTGARGGEVWVTTRFHLCPGWSLVLPVRAPFSITTSEPHNPLTSPSISPLERSYFGDFYWAWEGVPAPPPPSYLGLSDLSNSQDHTLYNVNTIWFIVQHSENLEDWIKLTFITRVGQQQLLSISFHVSPSLSSFISTLTWEFISQSKID